MNLLTVRFHERFFKKIYIFFFKESFFDNQAKPIKKIKGQIFKFKTSKDSFFGQKNKNKSFLVINRSPGAGLFSNVTFVINYYLYAKKKKSYTICRYGKFSNNL